jgi:hypothetical protein
MDRIMVKLPWRKPTDTLTYKRVIAWIDDNSDWLPWFVGAIIVLLLVAIFAAGLPLPPVWK